MEEGRGNKQLGLKCVAKPLVVDRRALTFGGLEGGGFGRRKKERGREIQELKTIEVRRRLSARAGCRREESRREGNAADRISLIAFRTAGKRGGEEDSGKRGRDIKKNKKTNPPGGGVNKKTK